MWQVHSGKEIGRFLKQSTANQVISLSRYTALPFTVVVMPRKLTRVTADRTTPVGQLLDKYLTNKQNLNDQGVHLLFSANRWELKYAPLLLFLIFVSCLLGGSLTLV